MLGYKHKQKRIRKEESQVDRPTLENYELRGETFNVNYHIIKVESFSGGDAPVMRVATNRELPTVGVLVYLSLPLFKPGYIFCVPIGLKWHLIGVLRYSTYEIEMMT